ncbi:DNA polymerase III subunit epsilon [Lysobacteraceae bacterium NML93-0792]|nr:DNA polymerase III subunit epsilon [Xanthomonadaceae bacterium NML93-0792]PBS16389.1 DNA polymerase III subunit epsilon [Xanthomonadaceae bacterium NML93-0793]PBS19198.1 DNA polymerase III subunit epsilon [Xanthomonadaceae bacterium NML93-0831]
MRQIVLDTETTGLEWKKGNRVVEIGCVELVERRPTGRTYHQYIRPDCDFEQGAAEVTGLSLEFLADKPPFEEIADAFLAFIDGAELVIHNAAFDVGFLDYELSRLGPHYGDIRARARIEDSLLLARQRFPGQRNSLDALCKRMGVDNAHRQLHGALLDAQLLAEVYLALTAGQHEIGFEAPVDTGRSVAHRVIVQPTGARPALRVPDADLALHAARVAAIRTRAGRCLWDVAEEAALPA